MRPGAEAVAGALGGVCSTIALYPVEFLITQVQVGRGSALASVRQALTSLKALQQLYHGLGGKILNCSCEDLLYFYVYSMLRAKASRAYNGTIPQWLEFLVGACTAWVQFAFTTPVEVVSTVVQTQQQSLENDAVEGGSQVGLCAAASQVFQQSGLPGFWSGYGISVVLSVNPAINFGVFEITKRKVLTKAKRQELTTAEAFRLGALAKLAATTVSYPLIRLKTLAQHQAANGEDKDRSSSSTLERMWKLVCSDSGTGTFASLYRGFGLQVLRSVLGTALMFAIREKVRALVFRTWRGV